MSADEAKQVVHGFQDKLDINYQAVNAYITSLQKDWDKVDPDAPQKVATSQRRLNLVYGIFNAALLYVVYLCMRAVLAEDPDHIPYGILNVIGSLITIVGILQIQHRVFVMLKGIWYSYTLKEKVAIVLMLVYLAATLFLSYIRASVLKNDFKEGKMLLVGVMGIIGLVALYRIYLANMLHNKPDYSTSIAFYYLNRLIKPIDVENLRNIIRLKSS
jgi:hypothetical protein